MEILSCSLFGVSRVVGAVALGWRSGARARCCFLPLFSPCVVHVRTSVDVHLDSCDRTLAVSFKTVISTAPSSTQKKNCVGGKIVWKDNLCGRKICVEGKSV